MNEDINLCELLKGHEGETFYSPIYGEVRFKKVDYTLRPDAPIITTGASSYDACFRTDGKVYNDGDICLFPSKDQRDWNKWAKEQKSPKTWDEWIKYDDFYNPTGVFEDVARRYPIFDDKTARAAIAYIKIYHLIQDGYGGNITNEEWASTDIKKYVIISNDADGDLVIVKTLWSHFLRTCPAFHTEKQANEFLSYPENVQLVKDFFKI